MILSRTGGEEGFINGDYAVVGGENSDPFDQAIDLGVSRLRRKLGEQGGAELIRTLEGEGYGLAHNVTEG